MIFQLGKKELFLRYENRNKIKEEIIKVVKKMICLLDAVVLQLIRLKSLTLGKIICQSPGICQSPWLLRTHP